MDKTNKIKGIDLSDWQAPDWARQITNTTPPADWLKAHETITKPDTDLRARLLAAFPKERRPGGITVPEALELWGSISYNGAARRLRSLVRKGQMTVETALQDGRVVNVYYWKGQP